MYFRDLFNIFDCIFQIVLNSGKVCRFVCAVFGLSAILIMMGCSEQQVKEAEPVKLPKPDLVHGQKYYQVKPGDTLFSIGYRSGLHYRRLAEWNNISPPYVIKVGQKIKLFKPKTVSQSENKNRKSSSAARKSKIHVQKKSIKSNNKEKHLKLYWQWPMKGRILRSYVQSGFKGIDIQGKRGQKVRAAEKGKVVYSGTGLKGYGNLLIIKHNEQYLSAYAHNKRLLVKEAQVVNKGQVIAEVGRNDMKQYVLHFEIRKKGKPVNPVTYLPKN